MLLMIIFLCGFISSMLIPDPLYFTCIYVSSDHALNMFQQYLFPYIRKTIFSS